MMSIVMSRMSFMSKLLPGFMMGLLATGLIFSSGCTGGNPPPPPPAPADAKKGGEGAPTPKEGEAKTPAPASDPSANSVIKGKITFSGTAPKAKKYRLSAEPKCVALHPGGAPTMEILVVDAKGNLKNVLVSISSGLPKKSYPTPTEKVRFDQVGCVYVPHVFAVQAEQTIEVWNSDALLHNVHTLPKRNRSATKRAFSH